jgi:hypothetical protein
MPNNELEDSEVPRGGPGTSTDEDLTQRSTQSASSQLSPEIQNALFTCDTLVVEYKRGKISKAKVYAEIQNTLSVAIRENQPRFESAINSFIATIESLDSEITMATNREVTGGAQ